MNDRNSHLPRKVAIPDHLWQLFEDMALKMGTDRDGLVCQAMFIFARLNGFIDTPGPRQTPSGSALALGPSSPSVPSSATVFDGRERPGSAEPTGPMATGAGPPASSPDETAALSARTLERAERAPTDEGLEAERGQLYVLTDSGSLDRVVKDRFVIGRGKHCDFIIHSGKVSREHAVVVREASDWFIEDLGSSNGTWFNKQRVKRRRVEDGDEYYICNEKIKFVLR
ncbi:MAG: FHA domain-containing protein [Myxococcaceae bacterium]